MYNNCTYYLFSYSIRVSDEKRRAQRAYKTCECTRLFGKSGIFRCLGRHLGKFSTYRDTENGTPRQFGDYRDTIVCTSEKRSTFFLVSGRRSIAQKTRVGFLESPRAVRLFCPIAWSKSYATHCYLHFC